MCRCCQCLFDKNSTGRILTRITNDVESVSDLFSGVIINIFKDIIMLIGIVSVMFYLDVKTALFPSAVFRYHANNTCIPYSGKEKFY